MPDLGAWDYTSGCEDKERVWKGECGASYLQEWLFSVQDICFEWRSSMGVTQRVGLASVLGALIACSAGVGSTDTGDSWTLDPDAENWRSVVASSPSLRAHRSLADFGTGKVPGEHCLSEIVPDQCSGEPGFTCLVLRWPTERAPKTAWISSMVIEIPNEKGSHPP